MSFSTRLRGFLIQSRTALSECFDIATALISEPATSVSAARGVLLRQARSRSNSVAASVLRADREVGLVQYHGLRGYATLWAEGNPGGVIGTALGGVGVGGTDPLVRLKKLMYGTRGLARSDGGGETGGGEQRGTGRGPKRRARVAFMITASQRTELTVTLGYGKDEIKKLKPLEALLILEHGVKPGNDETVRRLVQENEELQRAEAEEALALQRAKYEVQRAKYEAFALAAEAARRSMDDVRKEGETVDSSELSSRPKGSAALNSPEEQAAVHRGSIEENPLSEEESQIERRSQHDRLLEISGGYDPPSPKKIGSTDEKGAEALSGNKKSQDDTWYEVVQIDEDSGSSMVVALYRTEEEANECLDWKRNVARRHQEAKPNSRPSSRFEIRQR